MKSLSTLFATSAILYNLAAAQITNQTSQENATACVTGAHIIVARASNEQPGYGIIGVVKNALLREIPNSNAIAVPYPATINLGGQDGTPLYTESQPDGVGNMTLLIKQYVDACPGGRIALLGYSQGAHVVGDVILGSELFEPLPPLEDRYLSAIEAAILMGDPAFQPGLPGNVGNGTRGGLFARGNVSTFASRGLGDKVRTYCDARDTFCDRGDSLAVHVGYVPEYGNQSVEFVVSRFANSSSRGGATPTAGGAASGTSAPAQYTGGVASPSAGQSATMLMGALTLVFAFAL